MPPNLLQRTSNRLPARFRESSNDVFLLIKAYVSDNEVCQEPLVIWPGDKAQCCSDALARLATDQVPGYRVAMRAAMLHTVFARVIGEFLFVDLFGIEAGCHPGVATYLDDDRKEVLMDIATYLQRNYSNLGRGIAYLERLAGRTAFVRERPPTLQGLLMLDMGEIFAHPSVAKHIEMQTVIRCAPATTKKGFFLAPWHFDFSEHAKFGEVGRYPSNYQFKSHLPSFLDNGLETHRESIEVKFPGRPCDDADTCKILPFSAVPEELEEDEHACKVLACMRFLRCNFKKHEAEEHFLYESLCGVLSLANRTAEKSKPSALDLTLLFKESVRLKQTHGTAKSHSIRDTLYLCIQEYNKQAWRISDPLRRLIYNLLRCPRELWEMLKDMYNNSKPEHAAMTLENLDGDFYVPGTVLDTSDTIWKEIQAKGSGFGGGIRRADSERIIGWLNYAAAGVVSATKLLFTVEQVTAMAHSHPKTFAAIVLYPNRAGDLRTSPKNLC
ncbi:unnamed protein product [Durusdinium trenchii]|uniref:Uncharacterized protein n=1 Tax=Durusdinium trenchii TaxID=1381693 RepID=A0ABP0M7P2_9DINO